jgi:hypothetical protein
MRRLLPGVMLAVLGATLAGCGRSPTEKPAGTTGAPPVAGTQFVLQLQGMV